MNESTRECLSIHGERRWSSAKVIDVCEHVYLMKTAVLDFWPLFSFHCGSKAKRSYAVG
ncbi:MAG: hypothetical protein ACRYFU_12410 [Janthinobacterium lividum]